MRVRVLDAGDLPDLGDAEWVDRDRRIFRSHSSVYVPVRDGFPADTELPPRKNYHGRGYCMMGDVAVLHGAVPTQDEVRRITAWTGAMSVVHVAGIGGTLREPRMTLHSGSCGEVLHRENGITYRFDPSRVMFAMGNRTERARMGSIVSPHERVGDLCAGIGYFTIPMARAGASVHAIDLNPVAYHYLCRNIAENAVASRVSADRGDCRDRMHGVYDRIVIGHFQATEFLSCALTHAHRGTVLHLHGLSDAPPDIRRCAAEHGYAASVQEHRVKKYRPHCWHVVRDVVLS